ncbi:hypothetical protein V1514DRAFT_359878 [Lipomyces japonicus]|uniref:uncharacterized protein n=1 Tax=Lipomyces japonicus TaxID=56871 RepID=UPI0034CE17E0
MRSFDTHEPISDNTILLSDDMPEQDMLPNSLDATATNVSELRDNVNAVEKEELSCVVAGSLMQVIPQVFDENGRLVKEFSKFKTFLDDEFNSLEHSKKITIMQYLGLLSCYNCNMLDEELHYFCKICDNPRPTRDVKAEPWTELCDIFGYMTTAKAICKQEPLRISLMLAFRRYLCHYVAPDVSDHVFGKWLQSMFTSSFRECRLTASRVLPLFVESDSQFTSTSSNKHKVLEIIKRSANNNVYMAETLIVVLSELGKISEGEDLNVLLLRLINYLYSNNAFEVALAYHELRQIAVFKGLSVWRLMAPYWSTIGIYVFGNFELKSQMLKTLSDVLEVSVDDFLIRTQEYTVPYLVLQKKSIIIRHLAEITGKEVYQILTDNIIPILAIFLTQPNLSQPIHEATLLLTELSNLSRFPVTSLLQRFMIEISIEVLKRYSVEDEKKNDEEIMSYRALQIIAKQNSDSRTSQRRSPTPIQMDTFLKKSILGIISGLSDMIFAVHRRLQWTEKVKCIRALHAAVRFSKNHAFMAIPQILSCIQTALEDKSLQYVAIGAWIELAKIIGSVKKSEFERFLQLTISVLCNYWDKLTANAEILAVELLEVFQQHDLLQKVPPPAIPSPEIVPEGLKEVVGRLHNSFKQSDNGQNYYSDARYVQYLYSRCRSDNFSVVHVALIEMKAFILNRQKDWYKLIMISSPDDLISSTIQSLLNVCSRFNDAKPEIAQLSSECLGLIGGLDPNKLVDKGITEDLLLLSNFDAIDETLKLIVVLIDKYLVPAFRACTETKPQLYLAYAMQQLLKFGGFSASFTDSTSNSSQWNQFSLLSKVTLAPFTTSKYSLNANSKGNFCNYPIFFAGISHKIWLQSFTLDLLSRASDIWRSTPRQSTRKRKAVAIIEDESQDDVHDIFLIFSKTILNQDLSISSFLLPYIVQYTIVNGTDIDRSNILNEITTILQFDSPIDNFEFETMKMFYETVFSVLDHSKRWCRGRHGLNVRGQETSRSSSAGKPVAFDEEIKKTMTIVESVPVEVMGNKAFECNSFARSLYYYELFARECRGDKIKMNEIFIKLQMIYSKLKSPDSVQGISLQLMSAGLDQQILENEAAGKWDIAESCYEVLVRNSPNDMDSETGLMNCLRSSHRYENLWSRLEIFANNRDELPRAWVDFGIEASWVLEKWQSLDNWIKRATKPSFDFYIGKALLLIKEKNLSGLYKVLSSARIEISNGIAHLQSASPRFSHDLLFKLHALSDIEILTDLLQKNTSAYSTWQDHFKRRTEFLGRTYIHKRYLLDLHKSVITLFETKSSSDDRLSVLLQTAKLARKTGHTNDAFFALQNIHRFYLPQVVTESAKLQWKQGQRRQALKKIYDLNEAIRKESKDINDSKEMNKEKNRQLAKMALTHAKWYDQSDQAEWSAVLFQYNEVINRCKSLEGAYFHLGRYYLKIIEKQYMESESKRNSDFIKGKYHAGFIKSYCLALAHGSKYIFQALPKLVTIWLDCAEGVSISIADNVAILNEIQKSITDNRSLIPKYMFFSVLSQMLSRIVHCDGQTYKSLQEIVVDTVATYPQQALWSILGMRLIDDRASAKSRKSRAHVSKDIIRAVRAKGHTDISSLIKSAVNVAGHLHNLCEASVVKFASKKQYVLALADLNVDFGKLLPCDLVIPVKENTMVVWPTKYTSNGYAPFRSWPDTIEGISDKIEILKSLQAPKKIQMKSNKGRTFTLLCKPKDDLRKDARLMELNNTINYLLRNDVESSQRNLNILTYAVTPLSERSGLIEWVNDTKTLRDLLKTTYLDHGIQINYPEIQKIIGKPPSEAAFKKKILPMYPPVLYEWFIGMFPVATKWLESRTGYVRSLAVMSIIGYILGLGDRHCENILLHETTGEVLHVDFSCLFEKGLDLEVPEVVPFRLTHNLVDACGPYGYEGPFRRTCELTLKTLRENIEFLFPVLETFLHDPIVDWRGGSTSKRASPRSPTEALERIRNRLQGITSHESFALGVEGHVDHLINRATDTALLCKMYIGWTPFW